MLTVAKITRAGDYCGPIKGFTDGTAAVFFLKPNARDGNAPLVARHVQYVMSPPHVFTEEADGTLTIAPSISDHHHDGYHGYLEHGVWRKA